MAPLPKGRTDSDKLSIFYHRWYTGGAVDIAIIADLVQTGAYRFLLPPFHQVSWNPVRELEFLHRLAGWRKEKSSNCPRGPVSMRSNR